MAVLSSEYSAVEQALNAATLHITWSSLCLGQFIEDLCVKDHLANIVFKPNFHGIS